MLGQLLAPLLFAATPILSFTSSTKMATAVQWGFLGFFHEGSSRPVYTVFGEGGRYAYAIAGLCPELADDTGEPFLLEMRPEGAPDDLSRHEEIFATVRPVVIDLEAIIYWDSSPPALIDHFFTNGLGPPGA